MIPKQFTIFGNKVSIREIEKDELNRFGYWDAVREEIVIAHKVKDSDGVLVSLTHDQIESSFYHELIHTFQWFSKGDYDEQEAQTYSYMLMEFLKSSKIKINPNIINDPVEEV